MDQLLLATPLLDFKHSSIQSLVQNRGWRAMDSFSKIKSVYEFVRDEIAFGYNADDRLPASKVLSDGYGQCNTKGVLFMACLRAVGVPCRMHGFTIDKKLQKGAMTGFVYRSAPAEILHSWVEVLYSEKWYSLEAFILDKPYLTQLQKKFSDCTGSFCGYGAAVRDFQNPVIEWDANDTYIQKEGIIRDLGVYDSPDDFFAAHCQQMHVVKRLAFQTVGRHLMNRNVKRIRNFSG